MLERDAIRALQGSTRRSRKIASEAFWASPSRISRGMGSTHACTSWLADFDTGLNWNRTSGTVASISSFDPQGAPPSPLTANPDIPICTLTPRTTSAPARELAVREPVAMPAIVTSTQNRIDQSDGGADEGAIVCSGLCGAIASVCQGACVAMAIR